MFLCTARRPHDCVWDVLKDLRNALLIMKKTQSTYKLFLGRTHENITILKAKDGLQLLPASIHIGDGKINFGNDGNHIQMLLCWGEEGNEKYILFCNAIIGKGLGLNALRGIHKKQYALAGR